ncbi:TIGR03943 family putative permease subunit [Streptomyces sp. SP18CS02]|uniref:TIGR03943 family putative permease subunit n=1 Tax=Streptomyces sp. SP18CS02 TaxID=3002531 RepID=UPI002E7A127B|nr:TIGR03943 family protein [Streptomyces sp. SP18CS02]MEE1753963.1 TIGR03943 family protein [Streptomyces sp. SP18CS02]
MRRDVQAVLLLLSGSAVLHVSLLSELFLRYVKEGLRPFLVVSGVVLLVLGVASAVRDGLPFMPGSRARDDAGAEAAGPGPDGGGGGAYESVTAPHGSPGKDPDNDHGHGHDHHAGPRVAWVLFLPVLALLLHAPPALGSYTAGRETDAAVAEVSEFDPLPARDPAPLALSGFIARVQQDRDGSLRGRTVLMTGFVTPAKDPGGPWFLTRLVVSCCAADAQTLRVRVHGAPAPPADTWVTVTGTWHGGGRLGTANASVAVDARSVKRVPQPAGPYQDTTPLP